MADRAVLQNRTVLYVSGFSGNIRAKDLAYDFERYGRLIRCDIPALKSPTSAPFAFIEFRREGDAEEAYYDMHGRSIDGRRIAVQWAKRPPSAAWRHDGYGGDRRDSGRRDDRDRDDRRDRHSPPRRDDRDRTDDRRRSLSPRRADRERDERRSASPVRDKEKNGNSNGNGSVSREREVADDRGEDDRERRDD